MADKKAAEVFVEEWKEKGNEKQDTQTFWIGLLQRVFGVGRDNISNAMKFEVQTSKKKRGKDFKDVVIYRYTPNEILVEQKSKGIALDKPIKQSDGELLTPFEQAKRYDDQSIVTDKARWIITCNFSEFWIYDMTKEGAELYEPVKLALSDLPKHLDWLSMLEKEEPTKAPEFEEETAVSVKAGELVGKMYDAFEKQYKHDEHGNLTENQTQSLNKLCVRLVFCLYAEDSGLFRDKQFHDYMESYQTSRMRRALIDLFETLNTPLDQRDPYLEPDVAAFPYVNGGLFAGNDIEIPNFTDEIRTVLLDEESSKFDWSAISPTIFGAVFESTLNSETRRKGGMHYTSVENIHKVIDPLFLDDLKAECDRLLSNESTTDNQLKAFQNKLASIRCLDPAAGSGNFLTESYLSLRRLENKVVERLNKGRMQLGDIINPIQVSIQQFYGIEINDFACSVAQTALWIAEHKAFKETEKILSMNTDFLPLKTFTHIHEGNALRMDWNDVIPAGQLNYCFGNPPFVGSSRLDDFQKADRDSIFDGNGGELDYVACWYKKASVYIKNTNVSCAFVSTNSICQGQQVYPLWKPLMDNGIVINYAYRTFKWDSEASIKAHVYCIIVGFSYIKDDKSYLYDNGTTAIAKNINGYLLPIGNIFVQKRRHPFVDIPEAIYGIKPVDNGYLTLSDSERNYFVQKDEKTKKWIRPFITGKEYLYGKKRWCLWLKGISPNELKSMPLIKARVDQCHEWRNQPKDKNSDAIKLRDYPWLMRPSKKFDETQDFIVIPLTTGERREYVPFGFEKAGCIPGNSVSIIPNANLLLFGVLSSKVHIVWMKTVCGRLESRYRYASDIVYNTFPWPSPTSQQKEKIEKMAQAILNARNLYADSSLADLYDPLTMPIELRKAHEANDKAVMDAYGFSHDMTELEIVAELMKMYQNLVEQENK